MTREEAIDVLIHNYPSTCFTDLCEAVEIAIQALSAQPEIIRCKDCKHASPNGKYGCKAYHFKQYEVHKMFADDFCSKGERRTDE